MAIFAGIFKEHRFIIVVNKLDKVCHGMHDGDSDDEEELTEDDVVSKVLNFIREECECGAEDIPREAVIPVYGMWAYKARMLAREPTKASRKKKIVRILYEMYDQPVGQGENPKKLLAKKSPLELSQDLEKLSKIDKVEERYGLLHLLVCFVFCCCFYFLFYVVFRQHNGAYV